MEPTALDKLKQADAIVRTSWSVTDDFRSCVGGLLDHAIRAAEADAATIAVLEDELRLAMEDRGRFRDERDEWKRKANERHAVSESLRDEVERLKAEIAKAKAAGQDKGFTVGRDQGYHVAQEEAARTIAGLRRQLDAFAHSHGLLRKAHEPPEIKAPAEGFGNLIDAFDRIEWHGDAGTMRAIFEETTALGAGSITRRMLVETMAAPPKPEPEPKP